MEQPQRKFRPSKNSMIKQSLFRDKRKKPTKTEDEAAEIKRIKGLIAKDKFPEPGALKRFQDLPLSRKTVWGLKEAGFVRPTDVQKESIPLSLKGHDILGAAKTGSGKTLAFVIPVLEKLFLNLWTPGDGLGALIITPARELAYQIFETLRAVGKKHDFSAGLIIGGKDLAFERKRMDTMNIIICTPGRLLQHMDENASFDVSSLQILVLDEADRCLDMGFQRDMNAIIEHLPAERQTLLFSATQTKSVKDLARLSLNSPVYVSVHENALHSTPETLAQSYIVVPLEFKFDMMWSFIKHHKKSKILVFLSSCKQVRFIHLLFCRMRPGTSVLALYGSLHQLKRMSVYDEFTKKQAAVLFATDIAARGLDFPSVDWVVQLDAPEDADTYIHRAGRTARYKSRGESLLVLLPNEEEGMISALAKKKIPINKIQINQSKFVSVGRKFESLLARDLSLKEAGQRAFKAYLKAVFLMKDKSIFDVSQLDLDAFAGSLGLAVAPRVRFLQKKAGIQKKSKSSSFEELDAEKLEIKSEDDVSADETELKLEKNSKKCHQLMRNSSKTLDFSLPGEGSDDSEPDALFKSSKPADLSSFDDADVEFDTPLPAFSNSSKKPKSKASIAKKLLKKKITANTKSTFDESGELIPDASRQRQSSLAKAYEDDAERVGGIDIDTAKLILAEEDTFDKAIFRQRIRTKHREARLKARAERQSRGKRDEEDLENPEEEEEGAGSLSWLPDPDKIYGELAEGEDIESLDFEQFTKKRKAGGEILPKNSKKSKSSKRSKSKLSLSSELKDAELVEALALKLLGK